MRFLKRHIKPISIVILSVGGAISLGGFITFLVTGTYNIVELTGTKTINGNTEYTTSSHSSGWLNFDSYYWTEKYGEIDKYGKKVPLSFYEFMNMTNTTVFKDAINQQIDQQKQLQSSTNDQMAKAVYQYQINFNQGLLNVSNQYTIALVGCILFPSGITIALLITWLLVYLQKKIVPFHLEEI